MRVIRFRAWDRIEKQMFFDVSLYADGWAFCEDDHQLGDIGKQCDLMQYTGLKDKNGKEIYEGDLINGCDVAVEYTKVTIEWFNGGFAMMGHQKPNKWIEGRLDTPEFECEVIGNIYENPELLEDNE